MMRFSQYTITARILPAIICCIPLFIAYYFFLSSYVSPLLQSLTKTRFVGDVTVSISFVFLFAQMGRFIAKHLFERYIFEDTIKFPTTSYLLHSDGQYSPDYTQKIHKKVEQDFDIRLSAPNEEMANMHLARKRIGEAVSHMRTRVGKGRLLIQHNIEYGFFRNLIGGSVIALVISGLNLIVFYRRSLVGFNLSLFTIICYSLPILFSKWIMRRSGESYAQVLIQEYMAN